MNQCRQSLNIAKPVIMDDKELSKIALMAIPLSDCPRKRQQEIWRREKLVNRIKAYVQEQLAKQFNAKELNECSG